MAFGAAGSVISGVTETVTVLFLAAFILFELPRMTEILLSQLRPAGAHRAREIGGAHQPQRRRLRRRQPASSR